MSGKGRHIGFSSFFAIIIQAMALTAFGQDNSFSYTDFSDVSDLTFVRSAATRDNKLDLNGNGGNTVGAVWTKDKYPIADGFRTSYTFQIGAQTGGGSDGIWFYVQNRAADAVSASGYANSPAGGTQLDNNYFYVGIDTYRNPGWDPNNWHLEWGYAGLGTAVSNLNSTPLPDTKNSNVHTITIDYNATAKRFTAFYDDTLIIEADLDLESITSLDNGTAYLGWQGVCGGPAESHEILSWDFNQKTEDPPAQDLPEPLLYFPLDEASGATAAVDKTGNGYDGVVVNSVTFGEDGAPGGASPSGAAQFTNGILNIPTFDVPLLLGNRDGAGAGDAVSYTMAAWIKPDAASLSGDRFFVGQSSQGIHNGLRNNGRLHQAHWGNDHYGDTLLNATDWVHATFVYDGEADLGTIYLNGVEDGVPTSKAGPNGSGNLIVGGRQGNNGGGGGEAWYNGLIDEFAVWDSVLTQEQITALAEGAIPYSTAAGGDPNGGTSIVRVPVDQGVNAKYFVPATDPGPDNWRVAGYNDSTWTSAALAFGWDNPGGQYVDLFGSDGNLSSVAKGVNASIFVRIPITIDDPSAVQRMVLDLNWEDGVVGYLNGEQILSENAPNPITWNSSATSSRADSLAVVPDTYELDFTGKLVSGTNILAFQVMNTSPNSSDLLLLPKLTVVSNDAATGDDQDNDGMDDVWETAIGLDPEGDDSAEDPDDDGLTNLEEWNNGENSTNPLKNDSDKDGLTDGAERNTHATNPNKADSDDDGLNDGAEVAAGTDPFNPDTDGDTVPDGVDDDPLSSGGGFEFGLVSYWPLDSDLLDAADDNHGTEDGGVIPFETGKFGNAISLDGTQNVIITGGDESEFDFTGGSMTVSVWCTAASITTSWQCLIAKGEVNGWRMHRRGGNVPEEFSWTGGSGDTPAHGTAITVGGEPETWHHLVGVTDASTGVQSLYVDGVEVATNDGAVLEDRANRMRIGENPDALGRGWNGKVDDVAIWARALSADEISEIWAAGEGTSIDKLLQFDADQDGLPDKWEIKYGFSTSDNGSIDPNNGSNGDPDGDGLTNLEEKKIGTSPIDSDSDDDGYFDGKEQGEGTDPNKAESFPQRTLTVLNLENGLVAGADIYALGAEAVLSATPSLGYVFKSWNGDSTATENPLTITMDSSQSVGATFEADIRDPDGDGLSNYEELVVFGTDPTDSDSDGDGLSDAVEDNGGEFINLTQTGTNPLVADTDGDGLSDGVENPLLDFLDASQPGTDPNNEDSDKDGVNDGTEIGLGQNPTKFLPTLELSNFYESAPNQLLEIDASNSSNQISGTTYQWYFNGFPIPPNFGGTSPQITFDGTSNSEGSWSVTATNPSGEETATLQYRVFVDTDLDGLSDYREQNLTGTNFELADTDGDGLNDKLEYEGVTNPNLADSDEDGLSDGVEINQTQTDPTIADTDQDGIVDGLDDQDGDGLSNKDEIGIYGTSPLLADTDGDSIDDKTELEILSDPNTATTTEGLITIIRGMATIQSTDSDGDGLTDVKEAELESDSGTATTFYLSDVYDDAVESALVRGRGEVTSTPQNFNLISTAAYAALQVECDSRFLDTDGDGLTDQKEKELESDSSIETTFYLTDAYDEAVNSALISGRSEVTSSPQNFDLISTVAYNALQLQRDADLADYSETLAQKDGVIGTLNNSITAKDAAYALVVAERDANLETYTATLAAKDGVIGTLNNSITAKDAAYALVVTERDRNLETYTATLAAKDGVIGTLNDSITTKDAAYVTVVAERDARPTLAAYEAAVAESREAGQSDVTSAPATFGLFTSESYNMVIAERDARFVDTDKDGLTDVKEIELETDSTAETIFYLQDTYNLGVEWARFDGRSDVTNNPNAYSLVSNAQYNAVIAQRDARPTQVAFAKVIAERDARPTLGEVKDARLGSVVLQPDGANQSIKIRFSIEETDDFRTWIKRDGINEVTVPLEAGSKFYRFALENR